MKKKAIIFYIIFFLFCLGYCTTADSYDFDLWARLIAGMSVVQSGMVLKQDFLSYTPTHTWFDHEWGSGVIFYLTQHFFSSAGIIILQTVLLFLTFFFITKIVDLKGVKTTSAYNFLFYFFAFHAMSMSFMEPIRCQLFSFLFFAIFIYILELARKDINKPLWSLPLLMIFWNNLHGGCVAGIGLIILYIIGEFLNRAPVKKYIFALIPTVLVLVINPWGISYLTFLAGAATMQRPDVMEWWGLFSKFYMYKYMKFKIFTLALLLTEVFAISKVNFSKNIDKTKFLILLTTLILAINHVKLTPFFVIASVCFVYDDFYTMFNGWLAKINLSEGFEKRKEAIVYIFIVLYAFSSVVTNPFLTLANFKKYPLKEIEFVKINNIKGNLLINFGLGSYASYKLYPNNLIFMDGRYEEVYPDFMLPMMKKFYLQIEGKDELLKKFPTDIIIMEKYYPAYVFLKTSKDWHLAYEGKDFGVFVKSQTVKSYKNPSEDSKYYRKTLFDTNIKFLPKKSS